VRVRKLARDEGAYGLVPAGGAPSAPAGAGWRLWRCGRLSAAGAQGQRGSHSADSQTSADVFFCLQRKWPEAKIFIDLEPLRNFNVRAKVVGPGVSSEGISSWARVLTRVSAGSVRQVHPGRDGHARADQGPGQWLHGLGDGARERRAHAHCCRVSGRAQSATSRTADALSCTADRTRRWCRRAR